MTDAIEAIRAAADLVEQNWLPESPRATAVMLAVKSVMLESEKEELMLEIADLRLQIGAYKAQVHNLSAELVSETALRTRAESLLPDAEVFECIYDLAKDAREEADSRVKGPSIDLLSTIDWCCDYKEHLQRQPA